MKVTGSTSSSTCSNVNDVVGGRKTLESIVSNETSSGAVLVNIDTDDAVTFDDESLPFESSEESDDETEEESDEEDWSSEEEEYDAGKFYLVNFSLDIKKLMFLMLKFQRFPGATK